MLGAPGDRGIEGKSEQRTIFRKTGYGIAKRLACVGFDRCSGGASGCGWAFQSQPPHKNVESAALGWATAAGSRGKGADDSARGGGRPPGGRPEADGGKQALGLVCGPDGVLVVWG